ncbi:MAG: hypothetical protein ABIN91_03520 [Mucilaginibacter sp.]|uniref:hypothetical protein n=1 Tax=Mucilaginibacter sp. TaxID=1882438 RepID=UPI003267890F
MNKPTLLTFRRYNDVALSAQLVSILEKNDITYELNESPMVFSASMAFNEENDKEFVVKILPEDFEQVEKLIAEDDAQHIDDVDSDYYLFAFSDDELLDVVAKYDEWNAFDVVLARKLLKERGVKIDEEKLKTERIETLQKPEQTQSFWIIVGYVTAFLGGPLGILIGWFLSTSKKTLPNGERIYAYGDVDQRHGQRMFFIGIVVLVVTVGLRFYGLII